MVKELCIAIFFVTGFVQISANIREHVIRCLYDITEKYFPIGSSLVFTKSNGEKQEDCKSTNSLSTGETDEESSYCKNSKTWVTVLRNLFAIDKYSIVVLNLQESENIKTIQKHNHDGYIMMSGYHTYDGVVQDISQQVIKMRKFKDWSPRAKFIVVATQLEEVESDLNSTKNMAENILLELWRWQVVNAVVIVQSQSYISDEETEYSTHNLLNMFIWLPYEPAGRCGDVKDAILFDRWISKDNNEHFLFNVDFFPNKIPKLFPGCPLRVTTFEFGPLMLGLKDNNDGTVSYHDGIEHLLLQELAKRVNMTVVYRPPPPDNGFWGAELKDGTWNGVPGELMRGLADVGAAGIWYKCDMINEIECLAPHMIDTIRWYVPCASQNPRWTSITRVFQLSLWVGFLIAYIIVGLIMWSVVKTSGKITPKEMQNEAYTSLVKCLLNFWAVILEESASNDPPQILSIRVLFLAWVIYCMAVNTVYQTFLTTFLVDPGLQHQLSSEEEILESGLAYGVFPGTAAHIRSLLSDRYPHMQKCPLVHPCLKRVGINRDFAFVFSSVLTEYEISVHYMDADGSSIICDFDELVTFHLIILPVMKGYPMLERLNKIIRKSVEAGLVELWFNEIKYISTLLSARNFNLPQGEYIKLTMKHLQSAFYFLFLGYFTSSLVFIGEQIKRRYGIRKVKLQLQRGKQ